MIKVTRSKEPAVLSKNKLRWTRALLNATTPAEKDRAEKMYRHVEIKRALVSMFHGKCAYCESKIQHIAYGHIEHFRPKAKAEYRNLTFTWTNLLLSCPVCNSAEHKWDRFPEVSEGGPLVNPCEDDPNDHFVFIYDIVTKLATVVGKSVRGKTTEKLLGLNRTELRVHRSIRLLAISCG